MSLFRKKAAAPAKPAPKAPAKAKKPARKPAAKKAPAKEPEAVATFDNYFEQGRRARKSAISIDDCPHGKGATKNEWLKGYRSFDG